MSIEDHKLKPCPFCGNDGESIFEFAHCSNKTCVGFDMVATKQQWNARNQDRASLVSEIEASMVTAKINWECADHYEIGEVWKLFYLELKMLINRDKVGN